MSCSVSSSSLFNLLLRPLAISCLSVHFQYTVPFLPSFIAWSLYDLWLQISLRPITLLNGTPSVLLWQNLSVRHEPSLRTAAAHNYWTPPFWCSWGNHFFRIQLIDQHWRQEFPVLHVIALSGLLKNDIDCPKVRCYKIYSIIIHREKLVRLSTRLKIVIYTKIPRTTSLAFY